MHSTDTKYLVREGWKRFYAADSGRPVFLNVSDSSVDVAAIYGAECRVQGTEVTTLVMKSGLMVEELRNGANWYAGELGVLTPEKPDHAFRQAAHGRGVRPVSSASSPEPLRPRLSSVASS